jgi:hypothetical protein
MINLKMIKFSGENQFIELNQVFFHALNLNKQTTQNLRFKAQLAP